MKKSFNDLINDESPVLVDFSAEWCGPCKAMAPVLEELSSRVNGKAKVIKIDVDRNPKAAAAYQIQSVPTLMIFQNGEVKWRQSGGMSAGQLESILKKYYKA